MRAATFPLPAIPSGSIGSPTWILLSEIDFSIGLDHCFNLHKAAIQFKSRRQNEDNVTNFIQHSTYWEADRCSASQGNFLILRNVKVYCRVYNIPYLDPVLIRFNPEYILRPYSFKISLITVLPPINSFSKPSIPPSFRQKYVYILIILFPTHVL
jgi:hypothetical protein